MLPDNTTERQWYAIGFKFGLISLCFALVNLFVAAKAADDLRVWFVVLAGAFFLEGLAFAAVLLHESLFHLRWRK